MIDFPADQGCTSAADNNETNPRCNDGLDNDIDGHTDYPDDPGCPGANDNSEGSKSQALMRRTAATAGVGT